MAKITFIGSGSLEFTHKLVRDILSFPLLKDATITLMDIDAERLEFSQQAVRRIVDLGNYPAKVEATMDRVAALYWLVVLMCGSMTSSFPKSMVLILMSVILAGLRAYFALYVLFP